MVMQFINAQANGLFHKLASLTEPVTSLKYKIQLTNAL